MSHALTDLTASALALPEEERLALAFELIESVEGPADPVWENAWRHELQRRTADQGALRSWNEVHSRLLQRLGDR